MEQVLAGTFSMGTEDGFQNERPVHEVQVQAFCFDRTEITVSDFEACVQAGVCTAPTPNDYWAWSCNYGRSDRQDHPINCLTGVQAEAYCTYVGKRLPTEEEWEYAARGPADHRYPWGDEVPWGRACVDRSEGTCPVGRYPSGASPSGLLDMIGNAWEWTSSPYCYYNDPGCGDERHVVRGANWLESDPDIMRSTYRWRFETEGWSVNKGVRCAQ
jgi:formylglycine-generating enzyme required for sulfatase activity